VCQPPPYVLFLSVSVSDYSSFLSFSSIVRSAPPPPPSATLCLPPIPIIFYIYKIRILRFLRKTKLTVVWSFSLFFFFFVLIWWFGWFLLLFGFDIFWDFFSLFPLGFVTVMAKLSWDFFHHSFTAPIPPHPHPTRKRGRNNSNCWYHFDFVQKYEAVLLAAWFLHVLAIHLKHLPPPRHHPTATTHPPNWQQTRKEKERENPTQRNQTNDNDNYKNELMMIEKQLTNTPRAPPPQNVKKKKIQPKNNKSKI